MPVRETFNYDHDLKWLLLLITFTQLALRLKLVIFSVVSNIVLFEVGEYKGSHVFAYVYNRALYNAGVTKGAF